MKGKKISPAVSLSPAGAKHPAAWTFLSNHAHVLLCLAQDHRARLRDVAVRVGVTERAVQKIVADLEETGVLTRSREGRRNCYEIHGHHPLRHPIEAHCKVAALLDMVMRNLPRPLKHAANEDA